MVSLHDSPVVNKIMKDLGKECDNIINSTTSDKHYKICEKGMILENVLCRYDYFKECENDSKILDHWSPVD